jgi:type I restriction enzyme R subunit
MEKNPLTDSESKLFEALNGLKTEVDNQIQQNAKMLENENFIKQMIPPIIFNEFEDKQGIDLEIEDVEMINLLVVNEYMNEYHGISSYR